MMAAEFIVLDRCLLEQTMALSAQSVAMLYKYFHLVSRSLYFVNYLVLISQ